MLRTLPLVTAAAILLLAGLVHGLWTDRWHTAPAPREALTRLEAVPLTVGDWQGQALPADEEQRVQAEAAGCLYRRYQNRQTGTVVSILLVCGRPGPVSVHPPEVCFRGAGYEPTAAPARVAVSPATFWAAEFVKRDGGVARRLRAYWAWSADGTWQAPASPRLTYARFPVLYKLYVFREAPAGAAGRPEEEPCLAFLRPLLPELQHALFPAP
jgi:hypothetical protein